MKLRMLALISVLPAFMSSCEDQTQPVQITETRRLTSIDEESDLHMVMPKDWRRVPATQFRDFNFKFGKDGEVYLSLVSGSIQENADRWLRQFGKDGQVNIAELEKIQMLGSEGVIIEAEGEFSGMGSAKKNDMALLGALVFSKGNLISVKMVAEKEAVKQQRENFISYCKSLKWN